MELVNPHNTEQEIKDILIDALNRELTETEYELIELFTGLHTERRTALLEMLKELINKHKSY